MQAGFNSLNGIEFCLAFLEHIKTMKYFGEWEWSVWVSDIVNVKQQVLVHYPEM